MDRFAKNLCMPILLLLIVIAVADATSLSYAKCTIKKYKMCYNVERACPSSCPNSCIVDCASCESICMQGDDGYSSILALGRRSLLDSGDDNDSSHGNGDNNGNTGNNGNNNGNGNIGDNNGNNNGNNNNNGDSDGHNGENNGNNGGNGGNGSNNGDNGGNNGNNGDNNGDNGKNNGDDKGKGDNNGGKGDDKGGKGDDNDNNGKNKGEDKGKGDNDGGKGDDNDNNGKNKGDDKGKGDNDGGKDDDKGGKGDDNDNNGKNNGDGKGKGDDNGKGNGNNDDGHGKGNGDKSPTIPSGPPSPTYSPPPPSPSPPTPTPSPSPPPPPTPSSPPPPTPSSPPPPPPTPYTPSTPSTSPKTARCKNNNYPQCYNTEHACPNSCPGGCEVDCVTCKPVCKCDRPGAVCQDPRFIGGDGLTFYFHGKKDRDFCLVSDSNLHINAHFIGKRNKKMARDFTWVQSIAILFDNHQIFLGALKTSTWDDSVDRLSLSFDGEPLALLENEGSTWRSPNAPGVSVTRSSNTNNVIIEVEGNFKITAKVVPITEQDSRVHNYGITKDDCFAHLDLGFKFYSLSDQVNGVLGQTYGPNYVSRVKIGAKMPVMGGNKEFQTSSLVAPDCSVARFAGVNGNADQFMQGLELPSLSCASGIDGHGVVCKR